MTYQEMLQRLHALRRFGMRPGLDGMRALLAAVGDPQRDLAVVHVGGTNGKGSTAAMIEAALRADGRRTGLYTSPHLLRFSERMRLDGDELAADEVGALAERVFAAGGEYTFFEVATAMALLAFANHGVEVAVLEVGLGGRLDATNVIDRPLVSVVTSVALDHTEVLGDTLAAIAREKAGIFKLNVPALAACDEPEPRAVLLAEAARLGAPLELFGRDFDDRGLPPLALQGPHQRRNAALARQALLRLPSTLQPSRLALAAGLGRVRWPGRLEWLAPDVLVDAAHNGEGARALAAALPPLIGERPLTLILGVVADKDARAIVAALTPLAARIIAIAPPSSRALDPEALRALVPSAEVAPSLAAALVRARTGGAVLVAGSIFLVGEARRLVLGEAADAIAVQDPVGQKL